MVQIDRSSGQGGFTFGLHPGSREELLKKFPKVNPFPRIFIAFDTASDFQDDRGDLFDQVAELLTQLSKSELEAVGGFTVVDPVNNREIFSSVVSNA